MRNDPEVGIRVIDSIAIRPIYGLAIASGVVAVLDEWRSTDAQSYVGKTVAIRTPTGLQTSARISEVRDHGPTMSLFFEGLEPDSIPIGSWVDLGV